MKKIVIILVVVLVAWLAWDYWEQGQTSILGRQDFRGLVSRNADRGMLMRGPGGLLRAKSARRKSVRRRFPVRYSAWLTSLRGR